MMQNYFNSTLKVPRAFNSFNTILKFKVSLKSQDNFLTLTTVKLKHNLCNPSTEWCRIYSHLKREEMSQSEGKTTLSKTKSQQGTHQILQLPVWYLGSGFEGASWLQLSTFAGPFPACSSAWHMSHSSGIVTILGPPLQPRLHCHSVM